MDTADNDVLEVPRPLQLIVAAGTSLAERKPLRLKLTLYQCPYCTSSSARRPSRLKGAEKLYGRLLNMRRCRDCGHRFFAPFLLCVRPATFWASIALTLALAFCIALFSLVTSAGKESGFQETKYLSGLRKYNNEKYSWASNSAGRPQSLRAGPTASVIPARES